MVLSPCVSSQYTHSRHELGFGVPLVKTSQDGRVQVTRLVLAGSRADAVHRAIHDLSIGLAVRTKPLGFAFRLPDKPKRIVAALLPKRRFCAVTSQRIHLAERSVAVLWKRPDTLECLPSLTTL
jgi:hypothetical protein